MITISPSIHVKYNKNQTPEQIANFIYSKLVEKKLL